MISEMKSSNELNKLFWAVLSIKGDHTVAGRVWSPRSDKCQWEEPCFEVFEDNHIIYFFSSFTTFLFSIYFCFLLLNQVIITAQSETLLNINRPTNSNIVL